MPTQAIEMISTADVMKTTGLKVLEVDSLKS